MTDSFSDTDPAAKKTEAIDEDSLRERLRALERENKRLKGLLHDQSSELKNHKKALKSLSSSPSVSMGKVDAFAKKLTRTFVNVLGIDTAALWVYEDKYELKELCSFRKADNRYTEGEHIKKSDHPLFFDALAKQTILKVSHAFADPRTREMAQSRHYGEGGLLVSTVSFEGRQYGLLVLNSHSPKHWSPEEEIFISSATDFLSLAMEVAERRHVEKELYRKDQLLFQVVRAVNELVGIHRFEIAIKNVLRNLGEIPSVNGVRLYKFKENNAFFFQEKSWCDSSYSDFGVLPIQLPTSWIDNLKSQRSVNVLTEGMTPQELILFNAQVKSALMIPIECDGKLWGFIQLENSQIFRHWSSSEESLLRMVASAIGARLEHQQDEDALSYSENMFRSIFESASLGIAIINKNSSFQQMNSALLSMLGYDPESLPYLNLLDLCHPEDREMQQRCLESLFEGDIFRLQTECRYISASAEEIWVNFSASIVSNQRIELDTEITERWVVGIFENITQQKQAQKSSRRIEQLMHVAGQMANIGGWEQSIGSNRLVWTEQTYAIHELDPLKPLPPDLDEAFTFYPPKARELVTASHLGTIESQQPYDIRVPFITAKGNKRWVHVMGRPRIENGKTVALYGAIQDITDQKRAEDELRDLNTSLENRVEERTRELEKSKLQAESASRAKSEFLANMSHEIRTPMNAILGFSELLAEELTDSRLRQYLEAISSSGKTLLGLINDILDLSKIEAGKLEIQPTAVNPYRLLQDVQSVFTPLLEEKNIDFHIEVDPDLPEAIVLDGTRIRQILFNLVGNAIKFTQKGYVKLQVQKQFLEEDSSRLHLEIAVKDTGIGIPEADQQRIFEAFQQQQGQSNREYGGTGLGLAITRRLVEAMEGKIILESAPEQGSTFTVDFPSVAVAAMHATPKGGAPQDLKPEALIFQKAKVLLVDDIPLNRELIQNYFVKTPIDFIEAGNGKEALKLAQEHHPDLILMDLKMPQMTGYEATAKLKAMAETADIPIIALTASGMVHEEREAKDYGFDGYLRKPVLKRDLLKEMAPFLAHEAEIREQAAPPLAERQSKTLDRSDIHALRSELELLSSRWEKLRDSLELDEIESFAQELVTLGQQHEQYMIIDLGDNILEASQQFAMDKVSNYLAEFPQLLLQLNQWEEQLD
jgi:PAS domain S-box-containing protein